MAKQIYVTKMNGDLAPYDEAKLRSSMERAGADDEAVRKILEKVRDILYDKIPTRKIFRFVFSELKKTRGTAGVKYNLKQAMIDLNIRGAGFSYEKFMARIFGAKGYITEVDQIIQGKFIPHEIDIIAKRNKDVLMIEAKHHSQPWLGTDIKTALYVYARFLDVKGQFTKPMLVTNTKFSPQVMTYSKGVGMQLMGWNYPVGDSLIENIQKYKIYPITILPLKKDEIDSYLKKGILTFEDLLLEKNLSKEIRGKMQSMLDE